MINNAINWILNFKFQLAVTSNSYKKNIQSKWHTRSVHFIQEHSMATCHPRVPNLLSGCLGLKTHPKKTYAWNTWRSTTIQNAIFYRVEKDWACPARTTRQQKNLNTYISTTLRDFFPELSVFPMSVSISTEHHVGWDPHPKLSQSVHMYGTLATYISDHLSRWQKAQFKCQTLASRHQMGFGFKGCFK